jgi:hypothetical protein
MAWLRPAGEPSSQAALTATMRNSITLAAGHSEFRKPHRSQRVLTSKLGLKDPESRHEDIFEA